MDIAIISKNRDKFSETFIHNQVKHLPFTNHFLYGDYLPTHFGNNELFLHQTLGSQFVRLFKQKLLSTTTTQLLQEKIASYLLKNNVRVVLANYALSAFPFLDICQMTGIPLVVHFHGYTAYRNDIYDQYSEQYDRLFRQAAAIISVSDHMTNRLLSIGAPENKISKIVYGVDSTLFFPPSTSRSPNVILYSGRFCDTKNPHLVILAFNDLQKEIHDVKLVMVGDGELMPACVNLVKSLQLTGKIFFKGILPHENVAEEMRNATVLVQFSATTPNNDTEGTPLAILEAGLSELPIIAARSGGIPEIITDNENGYLVDELDTKALVQKMKMALQDQTNIRIMAQVLRGKILDHYTIEKYTQQLAKLLMKVAS